MAPPVQNPTKYAINATNSVTKTLMNKIIESQKERI